MTGIVLQARMGSTRLPGKTLMELCGRPLLEHILRRLTRLRHEASIVVATSIEAQDDALADFCARYGAECFRGSEDNVLERYCLCARQHGFEHVIRLTGDNPFVDIEELDNLIKLHLDCGADYSCSFESLPVGAGAEVFTFAALETSYQMAGAAHHKEHVNEYVLENPGLFKIARLSVPTEKNMPDVRLTVDTAQDFARAVYIMEKSGASYVTTRRAIELCLEFA